MIFFDFLVGRRPFDLRYVLVSTSVGLTFFLFFFTEFLPSFCAAVLSHSSLFALPQCKKKKEKKAKKKKNFLRCGCPFIALSIVLEKEI